MLFDDAYFLINSKPRFKLTINNKKITIAGHGKSIAIYHEDGGFFYFCYTSKVCNTPIKTAFNELRKVIAGGEWDRSYLEKPKKNYYNSPTWTGD